MTTSTQKKLNIDPNIPSHWALTPVKDKIPYRDSWQKETPLSRGALEKELSGYATGYGLRTGEISGGLIAVDVDGESAQPMLEKISGGDVPKTVTWTSGKVGRYQMLFQIPDEYREKLKDFTKKFIRQWDGYQCTVGNKELEIEGEQLEIRYNGHQSVLPSSYHPDTGQYEWLMNPKEVEIAIAPDWIIQLALGQLNDPVKQQPKLPKQTQQTRRTQPNRWEDYLENFDYRSDESIPLINCLSPKHRDLVESGTGQGNRDDTAAAIALDAVGCERWLNQNGQRYDGTAEDIIREFCSRCSPPLSSKDVNRIYKSAQRKNGKSSIEEKIGDDGLKAIVASYFWKDEKDNYKPPKRRQGKTTTTKDDTDDKIDVSLEISKLADSQMSKSEVNLKLNELSQQSGFIPSELRRMYEARLSELEKESQIDEHRSELETLFKLESASLNLENHIDRRLAHPISQVADILGTKPEAFLTTLLPVVASLTKIGTKVELIKATGFYALPILYTGIVGESGTAKSPTQKTILKPLFQLQNEHDEAYQRQYEQWVEDCKEAKENDAPEPPEPKRKELWTDDSTSEAIALIQSNQPDDGFLNWRDELSGLIKDNNKYRGKGSDAEKLLSGRDGSPIKVNRASGKRISCSQSGYSITGGTQPDTLRQQIDFNDSTGHWARFLWCILPLTQSDILRNAPTINIHELLLGIYKQIKDFEATTYKLSSEAQDTYADWYDLLESRKYNESRQGLRAVYSKAKADTGIIALLLHILNAAIKGETPDDTIDKTTLDSAIAINKFYLSQVRLIHSEGDGEDGNSLAPLYRKILDLVERKGSVTARDVARSSSSFKRHKPDDIRCLFKELEQMGKAKTTGTGTKLKLSSLSSSVVGVSSMDDDKVKSSSSHGSSHLKQNVVRNSDVSPTDTKTTGHKTENDPESPPPDRDSQDKNKTVVNSNNLDNDMTTMTTKSTQNQSQQRLEVDDKMTTKETTDDDKIKTDDKTSPFKIGDKVWLRDEKLEGEIININKSSYPYKVKDVNGGTNCYCRQELRLIDS